jgi:hypothetical protein
MATMSPRLRTSPWTKTGKASEVLVVRFMMQPACQLGQMKTN